MSLARVRRLWLDGRQHHQHGLRCRVAELYRRAGRVDGDVTIIAEKLADSAELHIWKAVSSDGLDSLSLAETSRSPS